MVAPLLRDELLRLAGRDDPRRLEADPLGLVHVAADREGAALVAALLAFGNVAGIRRSAALAIDALHGGKVPHGFRHRWIGAPELRRLLEGLARQRDRHGSLEALFRRGDHGDLGEALGAFCDALRGPRPSRGIRFLLPRPSEGSACKRPLLFLRWVARPADGVDLGLWRSLSPRRLVVPLDTHLHRIAGYLGWTARRSADWRAALEVTAALARIDPEDPVRFDFALAHLGISRDCPGRPVEEICARCSLRPFCGQWPHHSMPCLRPSARAQSSASLRVSKVSPSTSCEIAQRTWGT